MDINELKTVLAQCLSMSLIGLEMNIRTNVQYQDHDLGVLQYLNTVTLEITITGIRLAEDPIPSVLDTHLTSFSINIPAGGISTESYTFCWPGEIEQFSNLVNDLWKDIYEKMFAKKVQEIIDA